MPGRSESNLRFCYEKTILFVPHRVRRGDYGFRTVGKTNHESATDLHRSGPTADQPGTAAEDDRRAAAVDVYSREFART